jgi:homoserine dehydrogenase
MSRKHIKIGLFGFGCVGQGLYSVLNETRGLKAEVVKICIKDQNKKRSLPQEFFTYEKEELLFDDDINVIVELIDDADAAFQIVKTALENRKAVVTANKKMVAEHFNELLALQEQFDTPVLYESACCASIPIIRNLEEYYDNDLLNAVEGIFNGTSNYILTQQLEQGAAYDEVLKAAQQKGFAETNPFLDVSGRDARYKLSIIIAHAFGVVINPDDIFCEGITSITESEIRYAREKGYSIKLVSGARKVGESVFAYVCPQFVRKEDKLSWIRNEYNGVQVESVFAEQQFFSGKGAGSYPTGSAVLSDISALSYDYRYEYKKIKQGFIPNLTQQIYLNVYLRFNKGRQQPFDTLQIDEIYQSRTETTILGRVLLDELKVLNNNLDGISLLLQPEGYSLQQDFALDFDLLGEIDLKNKLN